MQTRLVDQTKLPPPGHMDIREDLLKIIEKLEQQHQRHEQIEQEQARRKIAVQALVNPNVQGVIDFMQNQLREPLPIEHIGHNGHIEPPSQPRQEGNVRD